MDFCRYALTIFGLACAFLASPVMAQETERQAPAATWRVVTKDSPPFAFQSSGRWQGISIELGEEIARQLGAVMEVQAVETVEELLLALEKGEADAALAAITVTKDRERRVDFSHPYYVTGLGVALRISEDGVVSGVVRAFTSAAFLQLVGAVFLSLVISGVLFWVVERKRHPQFRDVPRREGIGFGVWWSTIILFGHKGVFPKTLIGSLLAVSGMLVSILLLSVLTGAIASILTVSQLENAIRDASDLRHMRTLTVAGTASEDFLFKKLVPYQTIPSVQAGLEAVEGQQADALVYDEPILRYLVKSRHASSLHVLDRTFEEQEYAVAFPIDSSWRKPVNEAILDVRSNPKWDELVYRHLGR